MKNIFIIIIFLSLFQILEAQTITIPKNLFRERDTVLVLNKVYTLKDKIFVDYLKREINYKKLKKLQLFLCEVERINDEINVCIFVHDSIKLYQYDKPPSYHGVRELRVALIWYQNIKYFISCSDYQTWFDNVKNENKIEILFYKGSIKNDARMQNRFYKYFKAYKLLPDEDSIIIE